MVTRDPNKDETWAHEFSEAHDIDPKERREMLAIHTFYPPESRSIDLSYEHYKEAMLGIDDGKPDQLKRAVAYLESAVAHHWSHTGLRRHIRSSQATELPDTTQSEFNGYGAIFDFRRYIQHQSTTPLTPERARLLLNDIGQETLDFIDRLRSLSTQCGT
jgi:hypothetical protein